MRKLKLHKLRFFGNTLFGGDFLKKLLMYTGSFLAVTLIFGLCYYASYQSSLKEFKRRMQEQTQSNISGELLGENENLALLEQLAQEAKEQNQDVASAQKDDPFTQPDYPAALTQKKTILPTVTYIEETLNTADGTLSSRQTTAPGFLIGMTREELEDYVSHYMENLPLSEYEAGLLSYEVISFSEQQVTLRKSYDATKVLYKFYITILDGCVTVYYSDLKTVFEYTHIPAVDLPEELRETLSDGLYVKNREELYSILEGYSS